MVRRAWNIRCCFKDTGLSLYFYKNFFLIYATPGINCSVQSCNFSRRSKTKGISILKANCIILKLPVADKLF